MTTATRISRRWAKLFVLFGLLGACTHARADERFVLTNGLTLNGDLVPLMEKLSLKVDAFQAVWAQDPDAIIFGGAPRDFFYWVLGEFKPASNRKEIELVKQSLLRRDNIQTREFMVADSDLDVATAKTLSIDAKQFNLDKIGPIYSERLNIKSHYGRTEVDQGYLPAEKIALGSRGIVPLPQFRNGLEELFTGHFTFELTPPEVYNETYYVKKHLNHPILLVLRHLRLLAMDEYNRYGDGVPRRTVDDLIPPEQQRAIQAVVDRCMDGRELEPYLNTHPFDKWLNGTIRKAYRAHANPTLANTLMHHFGIQNLARKYSKIRFINNYLFAKSRNPEEIARHLAEFHVNEKKLFTPAKSAFPELKAYHGTEEWRFNAIMVEGTLHSSGGTYGQGLYCTSKDNLALARVYANNTDNIVLATIAEDAKIVHLGEGEGRRLFAEFQASPRLAELRRARTEDHRGSIYDDFAEYFGIDAVTDGREFAVKNSTIIESTTGAFKRILTFPKAMELAPQISNPDDFQKFMQDLGLSRLSYNETRQIVERIPIDLYVENIIGEKLFRGLKAPAAITLFEMTKDKVNLAKLYPEARALLDREQYRETVAGTVPLLSTLSDDLLVEVIQVLNSPDEIEALAPVLLARIDLPVAFRLFGEYLAGPEHVRVVAFRALRQSTKSTGRQSGALPWAEELVKESPLDDLEGWVRPEQLWVALSWLKSGFRSHQAFAALEKAIKHFQVKTVYGQVRLSFDEKRLGGTLWRDDAETIDMLESLRDVVSVLCRSTDDPEILRRALETAPLLGFAPGTLATLFAELDLDTRLAPLPRPEGRGLAFAFAEALLSTKENVAVVETAMPEVKRLLARFPEMLPLLYGNPTFRGWIPLRQLVDQPVQDPEGTAELLTHPSQLTRALAAVQLAFAGVQSEKHLGLALDTFTKGHFDRIEFVLEDQSKLELVDIEWLIALLVRQISALNPPSTPLRLRLTELPPLHYALDMTAFGSRYEIMRVGALLGEKIGDEVEMLNTLAPIVLDPKQPRNFKLAAARVLRQLEVGHPAKVELEKQLKWQFWNSRRRWWWFAKPSEPVDFFRDTQGLAANLFRLWRSRDADFLDYLFDISEGRGGGEIVPKHLADILVDLDVRDARFLPFFTRHLAKTGAKGMPSFFRALLRLYPARAKDILAAIFVVRAVPEILTPYLDDLVEAVEQDPEILANLREARVSGVVPRKKQVTVEGLWLDDWIKREVERRRAACERALLEDQAS